MRWLVLVLIVPGCRSEPPTISATSVVAPSATTAVAKAPSAQGSASRSDVTPVAVCIGDPPDPMCLELRSNWLAETGERACKRMQMRFERGGACPPSPIISCLMQNGMVRHAYAPSSLLEATATCELGRRHGARVLLPGQPREDVAHVVSCFAEGKCLEEHVGTSLRRSTVKQDCADIHSGRFAEQPCSREAAVGICHSIIYTREIYYAPAYDQAKARAACNDTGLGDFEAR